MKKIFALLCLASFICLSAYADVNVPANTSVPISLTKKQTSKSVASGTSIEAKIIENIPIDNVIVFKKGDRAQLNVLKAKKAGFVGIPGEILISGGKVFDINGEEHRVDFNQQFTGEEKTWPKVCLGCGLFIILAPLTLFGFVKGGQAEIETNEIFDTRIISQFSFEN